MDIIISEYVPSELASSERGFIRFNLSSKDYSSQLFPSIENGNSYAISNNPVEIDGITVSRNVIFAGNIAYIDIIGAINDKSQIQIYGNVNNQINNLSQENLNEFKKNLDDIILDITTMDLHVKGQRFIPQEFSKNLINGNIKP